MGRKLTRSGLVKKVDKIFSEVVRLQDAIIHNGLCAFCKRNQINCCFHFITRAKYNTRWDFDNCRASCFSCNYRMEFNPAPFIQWFINHYGKDKFDDLIFKSNQTAKFSNFDLEDMHERFVRRKKLLEQQK